MEKKLDQLKMKPNIRYYLETDSEPTIRQLESVIEQIKEISEFSEEVPGECYNAMIKDIVEYLKDQDFIKKVKYYE